MAGCLFQKRENAREEMSERMRIQGFHKNLNKIQSDKEREKTTRFSLFL